MSVKLLTEHLLEVLSLKGGCTGSSESTLVKTPHCWKLHAAAHIIEYNGSSWIKFMEHWANGLRKTSELNKSYIGHCKDRTAEFLRAHNED